MSGRWVDLPTAASLLGSTTEAVRKRATRGTLRSERRDGRVVVWVDEDRTKGGREVQGERDALLESKDETISILRDQLREEREARRRADTLLAQAMQANAALAARVPELEPAQASEEGTQEPARAGVGVVGRPANGTDEPRGSERPWWRRMFGQ